MEDPLPTPEAVSQVAIEIAATILDESKNGENSLDVDSIRFRNQYSRDTIKKLHLTERHEHVLSHEPVEETRPNAYNDRDPRHDGF